MNNVINKFNAGKYDDDIFVRTVRKTGKRGLEVLGWISKNPKLSLAAGATAWYLYDPEGFENSLQASGQTLGEFLGETAFVASAGVGSGLKTGLIRAISENSLSSMLIGGLGIALALLLWLSKTFRRLMLFPFTFLEKKANVKMDKMEQGLSDHQVSHTSPSRVDIHRSDRQPRSNL